MVLISLPGDFFNLGVHIRRFFQSVGELIENLGHRCIEHDVGTGDGLAGGHHPELELVSREGEGTGAVPVGHVHGQPGQGGNPDFHILSGPAGDGFPFGQSFHDFGELVSQED